MKKRVFCLILTVFMLLSLGACGGNKADEIRGNIDEITEENPGDIYVEIEFLGYEQKVMFKLFPDVAPNAVKQFVTRAERTYYDGRNIHRITGGIIQGGSVDFHGSDGEIDEREFFEVETSPNARHFFGALAMAADEQGRNYCQFYIVANSEPVDIEGDIEFLEALLGDKDNPLTDEAKERHQANLDKLKAIPENVRQLYETRGGLPVYDDNYTVFGQLVSGAEVIEDIAKTRVVAGNKQDDERGVYSRPYNEIIIKSITVIRIPEIEEEPEETTRGRERQTTTPPVTEPGGDLTEKVDLNEPPPPPPEDDDEDEPDEDGDEDETDADCTNDENCLVKLMKLCHDAETVEELLETVSEHECVTAVSVYNSVEDYVAKKPVTEGEIVNGMLVRVDYGEESWFEDFLKTAQ